MERYTIPPDSFPTVSRDAVITIVTNIRSSGVYDIALNG